MVKYGITFSLPVVVLDKVPFMDQIDPFNFL